MQGLRDDILKWFATGQVGSSSRAMACCFAGIDANKDHPHDPADLNRCLLLLHDYPELRQFLPKLNTLSPQWKKLIGRWDEVEKTFLEEAGLNWGKALRAPRTYALMKEIYAAV